MPGFSAIADSPIGGYRQDVAIEAASQQLRVYPPGSEIYDASIASTPLCGIPQAFSVSGSVTVTADANTTAASQSLELTENPVYHSDDDNIEVAGQVLQLTQNSVVVTNDTAVPLDSQQINFTLNSAVVEVQPPSFDSQSIALTLNAVELHTDVTAFLESQSMTTTENSAVVSNGHNIVVEQEIPMLSTLNSVGLSLDAVLTPASQQANFTLNSVSLVTDQYIVAPSQTIYTTLNRLREWIPINTAQPGSCTDGIDGQWTDIPFDTEIYGDNFAIAAEPIGSLPQPLPPFRKFPGTPWTNVPAQTTTTWSNIQT